MEGEMRGEEGRERALARVRDIAHARHTHSRRSARAHKTRSPSAKMRFDFFAAYWRFGLKLGILDDGHFW